MKYISTRSQTEKKDFSEIIIIGTAEKGGLYWPEKIPHVDEKILNEWKVLSYQELATEIISLYAVDIPKDKVKGFCERACKNFKNSIAPLEKYENNLYLLKLYQGPTLSFKDYAMQFLGQMVDYVLDKKGLKKQIISATSGDTGPAAIYGFKDSKNVNVKVYFPNKNVSKMQREQMTSIKQANIEVIPMEGSFDDCQKLVKDAFANDKTGNLMGVNSLNMGRIVSQIIYYVWTYLQLEQKSLNFFVPTGNFGNILAGYLAKEMTGANIKLSICVNENDTLKRFYDTGNYKPNKTITTFANAIDISNPSNFERIIWEFSNNKEDVLKYYTNLKEKGEYNVNDDLLKKFRETFNVYQCDAKDVYKKYEGQCPHTSIALDMALKNRDDLIDVVVSTADAIKFE
ncbi:MAG: threonine synthase [Rickettsiales bacterium]|jgi:threonine synthase|nr:threonine synthase [Rickettsiales bacterium]